MRSEHYRLFLSHLLAAGFLLAPQGRAQNAGGPGAPGGAMPPVEVTVVEINPEKLVMTTELPGRTVPYLVAEIRPQVNGLIQKRAFNEGALVKEGDVLYQIDPAPYQASLDNAVANLEVARKAADRARSALAVDIAGVNQRKATLDLVKINRERALKLFQESIIPASQRDSAVTEAQVAEAALLASEAQVESDKQNVASAEAAIKQADAAVQTARINLGYTTITAPISGRIGKSAVTIGAMVTAYQAASLATIQQLDPIYVDVPQSTNALLQLQRRWQKKHPGEKSGDQKVTLVLEDGSPYAQEGTMQFRDITVDPTTGSVTLRAVFPNSGLLMAGVFVRAVIQDGEDEKALLVPQQAIGRDVRGQPYVMIADKENKAQRVPVTLGQLAGNRWQVTSGLQAGDLVLIDGLQKVRPGSAIKPIRATAAPAGGTPGAATEAMPAAGGQKPAQAPASPAAEKK